MAIEYIVCKTIASTVLGGQCEPPQRGCQFQSVVPTAGVASRPVGKSHVTVHAHRFASHGLAQIRMLFWMGMTRSILTGSCGTFLDLINGFLGDLVHWWNWVHDSVDMAFRPVGKGEGLFFLCTWNDASIPRLENVAGGERAADSGDDEAAGGHAGAEPLPDQRRRKRLSIKPIGCVSRPSAPCFCCGARKARRWMLASNKSGSFSVTHRASLLLVGALPWNSPLPPRGSTPLDDEDFRWPRKSSSFHCFYKHTYCVVMVHPL